MITSLSNFGAWLESERRRQSLTYQELAERCGIHAYTLRQLENGKVSSLSFNRIAAIANALGFVVSLDCKRITN